MRNVFFRTFRMYFENLRLIVPFSVFALLSILFIPLFSGYVNAGGGFLRISSVFYDINSMEFSLIVMFGILSIVFLSVFFAAIVSVVKLKETLDHVGYLQVVREFSKYVFKLLLFFLLIYVVQLSLGYVVYIAGIPIEIFHLVIILIWLPLLFYPQIIVIESASFFKAFRETVGFSFKHPLKVLALFFTLVVLVFGLLLIETILGQYFVYEHKIVGALLLSFFVLPIYAILGTELYMKKYPISG